MKKLTSLLFSAVVAVLFLCQASPAGATTTLTNPFGNDPTNIYLGLISPWGTYVVYSRISDGACNFYLVGDVNGLSDNLVMNGGGGNDFVATLYNAGAVFCGYTMTQSNYRGHNVTTNGLGGNDTIWVGGVGNDFVYGGAGNDWVRTLSPLGLISGDDGNDTLISDAMSGGDRTYGGNGNDCMEDTSRAASVFDCGAGYDTVISGYYPPNKKNCERIATSCN